MALCDDDEHDLETAGCTAGNKICLKSGDQWRSQFSATVRTAPHRYLSTLLPLNVAKDARPVEAFLIILPFVRRNCRDAHSSP